jgi:hypothetical protein
LLLDFAKECPFQFKHGFLLNFGFYTHARAQKQVEFEVLTAAFMEMAVFWVVEL